MKIISSILLAAFFVITTPYAEASTNNQDVYQQLVAIGEYLERLGAPEPLSDADIRETINDGLAWTVAAQEENGHFGYEYAPFEGEYMEGEGMVRQAGTLFMLSEVYKNQSEKDPAVATAIENAIDYFASISADGESDEGDFWCIKKTALSGRCDLGSVALALIGILNYVEAEPDKADDYAENIELYVNHLKAAKFANAGFSNRYDLEDGFVDRESPFFNGEAMLALVRYYQYQPDEEIREMLEELFVYLSSKDEYESPLYLWIMAALKDMHRLWPNQAYVTYADDFTAMRLTSAQLRRGITHNYCAPLEGLVSAYSILETDDSVTYLDSLDSEIDFWLAKSTWLQLDEEKPYRVVTMGDSLQLVKLPVPAQAHGGFLTDETVLTQRIDFTQHCVSSYLQKLVDIEGKEL